jgi:hypothetical protein
MDEDQNLPTGQAGIPEKNLEDQNQKMGEGNENILPPGKEGSQEQTIKSIRPTEIQTKSMEVHHHPDLHHRKKHWKEYFLEFLMIFLAVTLGFFAESIRENISDKEKKNNI